MGKKYGVMMSQQTICTRVSYAIIKEVGVFIYSLVGVQSLTTKTMYNIFLQSAQGYKIWSWLGTRNKLIQEEGGGG